MYKCISSIYCEHRYLLAKRETLAMYRNVHVIFLPVDKFQLVSFPLDIGTYTQYAATYTEIQLNA